MNTAMDNPRSKNKTSTATWIFTILVIVGIITVLGVAASTHQNQQTSQNNQANTDTASSDNLKLQNECIANAQATDQSNPVDYSTLAVGDQPPGWTLAGQEQLQTQIAGCSRNIQQISST